MTNHKRDRDDVLNYLRYELVGPWEPWDDGTAVPAVGAELDMNGAVVFPDKESAYGPFVQAATGEEILQRDRPCKRYGVAVLYPVGVASEASPDDGDLESVVGDHTSDSEYSIETLTSGGEVAVERIITSAETSLDRVVARKTTNESNDNDFDLTGANEYRPSTMAVSFLAHFPADSSMIVEARGGRYERRKVQIAGKERIWWVRIPIAIRATLPATTLTEGGNHVARPLQTDISSTNLDGFPLEVSAFSRPRGQGAALITVSLTNRSNPPSVGGPDEHCIFQARFRVTVELDGESIDSILPYPERGHQESVQGDSEQESFDLLYRRMKTFGVGHGCAADWDGPAEDSVREVRAEPLPVVETPSITPQIFIESGSGERHEVTVPMGPLAGLDEEDDGFTSVQSVINLYADWLSGQRDRLSSLEDRYQAAANRHVNDCQRALDRMRRGLDFVRTGNARKAFELANEAILLQQLRTRRTARPTVLEAGKFKVTEPLEVPDWRLAHDRGSWRPFQIAFLLATVESVANPNHPERDTVELIWFPTGGGKTEAYLGLAAFSLFYRRLQNPDDHGVEVLMRYTLRLLTQQQFLRASGLTCAMEYIRQRENKRGLTNLGGKEFSIGIWLGGDSTPNGRADARRSLRLLNKGDDSEGYRFVLLRCPWCSAQIGPLDRSQIKGRQPGGISRIAGLLEGALPDAGIHSSTVYFRCPDGSCDFRSRLPVYVVDEDIYEVCPSIVVATVDKFAQLSWNDQCRSLFGIGPNGSRITSPPQTIIQDELHLISGPLGSLVGLYESVIEQLCTDYRSGHPMRPKIISSTATIRRYEDQIRSLYARSDVALFPPRGLDAEDSFFARFAREQDGDLSAGRMYVGIHAPGLGSIQTAQVRTFSALLQAPQPFDEVARDPWWSLMVFFNSLRELGTSLSLLQSDIPDYLKVIRNRFNLRPTDIRRLRNVVELTGRLANDRVPKSMEELSQPASADAVDVCLASSVIEVGIDIDRLSVMTVVGQPKTTSQYIQVTGRVGRQWWSRPGLITTIFSPTKPRDRSHFEKFRSYHERLYAQVEPTSVTPFSPPVLDRALHAVLVAYVRQNGASGIQPWPVPHHLIERAYEVLAGRVADVDKEEIDTLERVFEERRREWTVWERTIWQSWGADADVPLLRRSGEYASRAAEQISWSTPTSLRNVDAECRAEVSLRYVQGTSHV